MNDMTVIDPNDNKIVFQYRHSWDTYDEWLEYGRMLVYSESDLKFQIGDWLNFGEQTWGEIYAQAIDVQQAQVWVGYAWVARRCKVRFSELYWSHHRAVAAFDHDQQIQLLKLAIQEDMSARELERVVKSIKSEWKAAPQLEEPEEPAIVEVECPICKGCGKTDRDTSDLIVKLIDDWKRLARE